MAKKYEVIRDFTDLQDKNKVYRKGDSFPQPASKKVSVARIKELTSDKNKQGQAVIKEVVEFVEVEETEGQA